MPSKVVSNIEGVTTCWGILGTKLSRECGCVVSFSSGTGIRSCKERNSLVCSEPVALDGGCRGVKADIGKVIARGLQGHRLSTTVDIATIQSPDTHPSDNPSLRDSRRVNVPKEGAAYALGNTGRADGLLKPGGHILADTCIDGEWSAVL